MSMRSVVHAFPFALLALAVALIVSNPVYASAQSSLDLIFRTDLTLHISPLHPAPGNTVHAMARSSFLDLSNVALSWSANGKTIAAGIGITEIDIPAGALGSETRLIVTASENGLPLASAEIVIHPVELDLVWEADSYVPPLYRGRALPSAETNIRLEAMPRFTRNGTELPVREMIFIWKRNGYVMQSISGRGKSKAIIESPGLYGVDTISVEVKTSDGALVGEASARIASHAPRLVLYQDHPVFGIMFHRAFSENNQIAEAEASFAAIPYFADISHPDDPSLQYQWKVNGVEIENDENRPSAITINAEGSTGEALIELALTHVTNLFLNATASWKFLFNSSDSNAPFTGAQQ